MKPTSPTPPSPPLCTNPNSLLAGCHGNRLSGAHPPPPPQSILPSPSVSAPLHPIFIPSPPPFAANFRRHPPSSPTHTLSQSVTHTHKNPNTHTHDQYFTPVTHAQSIVFFLFYRLARQRCSHVTNVALIATFTAANFIHQTGFLLQSD